MSTSPVIPSIIATEAMTDMHDHPKSSCVLPAFYPKADSRSEMRNARLAILEFGLVGLLVSGDCVRSLFNSRLPTKARMICTSTGRVE